jgi:hypothetical protein
MGVLRPDCELDELIFIANLLARVARGSNNAAGFAEGFLQGQFRSSLAENQLYQFGSMDPSAILRFGKHQRVIAILNLLGGSCHTSSMQMGYVMLQAHFGRRGAKLSRTISYRAHGS